MVDILAAPQQDQAASRADTGLRTLTLISVAHWVSHVHILVLPMLFPFLKATLGVDYLQLGFALTVFAVVSALTQAPTGYLVDHFGARRILLIGMILGGLSLILLALHLTYPVLVASTVLLGLANSVYHPADYAILAAHMDEARMGRAFSIHTFAGYLGTAVTPAIVAGLSIWVGGTGALIVIGAMGIVVALSLLLFGVPEASAKHQTATGEKPTRQNIITPALMVLTIFSCCLGSPMPASPVSVWWR
jgi:MFS family permease